MASNPDFPSIGSLAERTDALEEADNQGVATQTGIEEDRPLQEIESLCMACGEQVFTLTVPNVVRVAHHLSLGHDPFDASLYPLLQGSHRIFFSLSALWQCEQ
jgi:hypothetical protein